VVANLDSFEKLHLHGEVERLMKEFEGKFDRETVERYVRESLRTLGDSHVAHFLPSIAGRFARERLRALGQTQGLVEKKAPEVLFVCVRNSGRSQMAVAFAQALGGDRISVRSAGSNHADRLDPLVVAAMAESGIDIEREFPKPLTDEVMLAADVVVTMGCEESTCPFYPSKSYRDWSIPDPAGKPIEKVREIRDSLRAHVATLLTELDIAPRG
jgi:protein-tyrosine-phosphatase